MTVANREKVETLNSCQIGGEDEAVLVVLVRIARDVSDCCGKRKLRDDIEPLVLRYLLLCALRRVLALIPYCNIFLFQLVFNGYDSPFVTQRAGLWGTWLAEVARRFLVHNVLLLVVDSVGPSSR